MSVRRVREIGFILTLFAALPASVFAQMDSIPRFRLQVLAVAAHLETTVRYDFPNGILAARVGFEKNLGLDESELLPALIATFRIGGRHHVVGSYYELRRTGTVLLGVDIPLPDTTLTVGTDVSSRFSTRVLALGYGYSLLQTPQDAIIPYVALYLSDWRAAIEIQGPVSEFSSDVKLTAPLPMIGAAMYATIFPRVVLAGNLGLFFLRVGDYDGSITDLSAQLAFRVFRFLGIGLGYAWFNVNVNADTNDFAGSVRYRFDGPSLSATLSF